MIGAWLADKLTRVAFWFILWGVRQALALHAGMPGMKYRLTMDGGGLMPAQTVEARRGSGAFVTVGALMMLRADARDLVHDASLGAFVRELVAADDAERAERKAKVKKPTV